MKTDDPKSKVAAFPVHLIGVRRQSDGKRNLRIQLRKGCVDVFFDQTGMVSIDACLPAKLARQIVAIVRSSEKKRPEANVARAK
jgi:hypothetical protein